MADAGAISPQDLDLFQIVDTPEDGFRVLRDGLTKYHLTTEESKAKAPDVAKTNP
jgi:predicted Rossmann-fold nucleotide-binding protein